MSIKNLGAKCTNGFDRVMIIRECPLVVLPFFLAVPFFPCYLLLCSLTPNPVILLLGGACVQM